MFCFLCVPACAFLHTSSGMQSTHSVLRQRKIGNVRLSKPIYITYFLKFFMAKTISKEIPLAEITLRRYEKPSKLSDRELVRKLCLSIGLLQPGDSRDVIVDILHVLLKAKKLNKALTSEEIEKEVINARKKQKLPLLGIASSNIRRQIKRLRDLFLVEKIKNSYRISEFENLGVIFEEKIEKFYLKSIVDRVKEYFESVR